MTRSVEDALAARREVIARDLAREREALHGALSALRPAAQRAERVRDGTVFARTVIPVVVAAYGVGRAFRRRSGVTGKLALAIEIATAWNAVRKAVRLRA